MLLAGSSFGGKKFLREFEAIAADLDNFAAPAVRTHQLGIHGQGDGCVNVIAVGHFLKRIFKHLLPIGAVFG